MIPRTHHTHTHRYIDTQDTTHALIQIHQNYQTTRSMERVTDLKKKIQDIAAKTASTDIQSVTTRKVDPSLRILRLTLKSSHLTIKQLNTRTTQQAYIDVVIKHKFSNS